MLSTFREPAPAILNPSFKRVTLKPEEGTKAAPNAVACPACTARACRYTSNVRTAERDLLYETAEATTGQLERDEWL